jgi:hypothetical protein
MTIGVSRWSLVGGVELSGLKRDDLVRNRDGNWQSGRCLNRDPREDEDEADL